MKFIVNSQLLSKQISSISGIIVNSNAVPIINCFHFHVEGNSLTVKTTDLATTLTTTIVIENSDEGGLSDVAIPSSLLLNILKNLNDAPIVMEVDESNYTVTITSGEGQYRISGRNAETYPALNPMEDSNKLVIPASVIVSAINTTSFAASSDEESHQQLSGILLEIGSEYTTFVATDGHKLVRFRRNDIKSDEPARFILPSKPINIVKSILSSGKEDYDVVVEYNNVNVSFSFGNYYAVCRLIDGKYPNYDAAIPKNNPSKLTADRLTLLNTLRRVSLFANQATNQVRLSLNSDNVVISSEDIEFANDAHEKIPCAFDGEPFDIGFNARYLIDMLGRLDTEEILMELASPVKPGIITPLNNSEEQQNENVLMLVMPVSLSY
ncbi:MAG: DNA polymerase III subunit beta [Bacteroidales bacterium]|nr:DNA polymerase III subunit beta [Bacteroidales bacterium]